MIYKSDKMEKVRNREVLRMQIRLVVGEQDRRYLDRLTMYLEKNYMNKLEIVTFSGPQLLLEYLSRQTADVILIDESFGLSAGELSQYGNRRLAVLSEKGNGVGTDGVRRIAKYQKTDLLYKDILDIYAEGGVRPAFCKSGSSTGRLTLVTGFSGGTGASTFAAALAKNYALKGQKTLYLNLETTGMSSSFFSGSGAYHFEDVIFALKSQRTDISLKLESAARQDASGVYYFEPCTNAMYMLEMKKEDILKVLDALAAGAGYDSIIVDMDFRLSQEILEIMNRMSRIIVVQDGGETSNSKFLRTMEALRILEQQSEIHVSGAIELLYNRFSSSSSSNEIPNISVPVIGKIPPIKHATGKEIIDYMLTRQEIFKTL